MVEHLTADQEVPSSTLGAPSVGVVPVSLTGSYGNYRKTITCDMLTVLYEGCFSVSVQNKKPPVRLSKQMPCRPESDVEMALNSGSNQQPTIYYCIRLLVLCLSMIVTTNLKVGV